MKRLTARIRQTLALRAKHHRILRRSTAREDDLLEALDSAHRALTRKRKRRQKLRQEDRRENRRAELGDEIDELEAVIDRLTDRLDFRTNKSARVETRLKMDAERLKRLRNRREELKDQRGNLTEHFSMVEFNCREGGPVPDYMEDSLRDLCKRVLEPMRAKFGACHINSGHRWEDYNRKIGGASLSYHVYENRKNQPAADCTYATGTPAQWAAYARELGVGGVGQYSSFVHQDTGPRRDWWG